MSAPNVIKVPLDEPHISYSCLKDVETKSIRWLWEKRIALGKLSLIAGPAGLGKSLITTDLAARVTTGGHWPIDDTACPMGSVAFLQAEDDVADTIKPRLEAAGADVSKVIVIEGVIDNEKDRAISFQADIERLGQLIRGLKDCRLIVIDPVSAYMDGVDSHKNAEVRSFLRPLKDLAEKTATAIILVSHLNKNVGQSALDRISGSNGLPAICRSVFNVSKDQDDEDLRLFVPVKNNIGIDRGAFTYRIEADDNGIARIEWGDTLLDITADEAISQSKDESRSAVDEAVDFLQQELNNGRMKVLDLKSRAESYGIKWSAIRRAQKQLNIEAHREGGRDGHWYWSFPDGTFTNGKGDHEDARPNAMNTLNTFDETQAGGGFKGAQRFKGAQDAQDFGDREIANL